MSCGATPAVTARPVERLPAKGTLERVDEISMRGGGSPRLREAQDITGEEDPARAPPPWLCYRGVSEVIVTLGPWAAFLAELAHGWEGMRQPFHCATPEEVAWTHRLFTAALRSHADRAVVSVSASSEGP
jgi:hypothetical protein